MMMQDEVIKGNLELVWIGNELRNHLVKTRSRVRELRNKLLNNKDLQTYFENSMRQVINLWE